MRQAGRWGSFVRRRAALYERFRRVTFRREDALEDSALAGRLGEHRQVLCIVNSRRAAQRIYELLPRRGASIYRR